MRSPHEALGLGWIDPHQDTTLTARGDRHVPVDQERQAAEHLFLREPALSTQHLAKPVREVLIERHATQTAPAGPVIANADRQLGARDVPR